MPNRSSIVIVAALVIGTAAPASAQERVVARIPGYQMPFSLDSVAVPREIRAPRAQAFATLVAAIEAVKLPKPKADSVNATVVQPVFSRSRMIGSSQMAEFFDCGSGQLGPNANRFRLRIAYAGWVDSIAPDRSRVRFAIAAGGEDMDGASKDPVGCASTGRLEAKILNLVQARYR
jgi:hypothetical protein